MVEKVIVALDPEGKKAEIFKSAVEAARAVGVSKQAVAFALKNGGMCAGRKWKRSSSFLLVKSGGKFAVCQKEGNSFVDLGTPRVFKANEVDRVVDVTAVMWEATL